MPDGRPAGGSGLVPPEWRKRPAAPAEAVPSPKAAMSMEDVSRRWQQLMDKQGRGELSPDEAQEAAGLEAQLRRMRASSGPDSLAA